MVYMSKTLEQIKASAVDLNSTDPAKKARAEEIKRRYEAGMFNEMLIKEGAKPVPIKKKLDLSKVDVASVMASVKQKPNQQTMAEPKVGRLGDIKEDFSLAAKNVGEQFGERVSKLGTDIARRKEDGVSLREAAGTGLGYAAATLATAFDTLGETGMAAVKSVLTPKQEQAISDAFTSGIAKTLEATEGSIGREKVEQMIAAYNVWADQNPEAASNVRDASSLMLSLAEAAGFKGGSTAAREAADVATDAVVKGSKQLEKVGNKADEALRVAARSAGEAVDIATESRRAARVASQQEKVDNAVARITQAGADDRAKEQARRALTEIDTTGVKTYDELNNRIDEQIKAISQNVDAELNQFTETYTPQTAGVYTKVGDKTVTQNPVLEALDGLETAYNKSGEAPKAEAIRQLRQKFETDGLTVREMNDLAREYGIEYRDRSFTKMGDPKAGFNAENYENVRSGLKQVVRDRLPTDTAKELDAKISDLYATRDLTSKIEDRVAKLQQRITNRTLPQKVGGAAAQIVDLITMGGLRGFIAKLSPSNIGNKAMNALEIEKELKKNLKELDKLLALQDNKKFADAFEKWAEELQPGLSTRVVSGLDAEEKDTLLQKLNNLNSQSFNVNNEVSLDLFDRAEELKKIADKRSLTEQEYIELNQLMDALNQ